MHPHARQRCLRPALDRRPVEALALAPRPPDPLPPPPAGCPPGGMPRSPRRSPSRGIGAPPSARTPRAGGSAAARVGPAMHHLRCDASRPGRPLLRSARTGGASTCTRSHGSGAPSSRKRSRANSLGTITASACSTTGAATARGPPRTPAPRRGCRGSCAAPRAACCARGSACTPARRVKHTPTAHTRRYWCRCSTTRAPAAARRRQRPPAKRRVEVVRVHHPRSPAPHRVRHLSRVEAAAQQPRGGPVAPAAVFRIPRHQLGGLAQPLTHQPHQVVHHTLLTSRRAVAVVQEEDHCTQTMVAMRILSLRVFASRTIAS